MKKAGGGDQKLDGFNWDTSKRPMTLEDLLFEKDKKEVKVETALKSNDESTSENKPETKSKSELKTTKQ